MHFVVSGAEFSTVLRIILKTFSQTNRMTESSSMQTTMTTNQIEFGGLCFSISRPHSFGLVISSYPDKPGCDVGWEFHCLVMMRQARIEARERLHKI